jgi:hypothetical protein
MSLQSLSHAFAITKNDNANLAQSTRGIYVGAAGDLKIDTTNGDTVTLVGLAAGVVHPIAAKKVYSTGTTATGIVGLY